MNVLDLVKTIFLGGTGASIGGKVAELGAWAALLASATPLVLSFYKERNEVLLTVTVGQGTAAILLGVFVVVIVRIAHRAPQP